MINKIGNVKIDDTNYSGFDIYSDDPLEDELLEIATTYSEDEYNYVINEKKSWPVLCNFSNLRENIVSWLPITKNDRVLEIGAGCGAISGMLSKMAGAVDAIELSMKRAMVNAYRHRNLDNLTIYVGDFRDIEIRLNGQYDYITLIGGFEHAAGYINSDKPYEDFLKILKKHLVAGGKLVVAIENRIGLKYWAGSREDHTGNFYENLEGYDNHSQVKTFTKKEWKLMVQSSGYEKAVFYYPYPDYKFPEHIFSDEYLPDRGILNNNVINFDRDRYVFFDESKVFDTIVNEGLFAAMSNSFLIVME